MSQTEHTASDRFSIIRQIESGQIDVKECVANTNLKFSLHSLYGSIYHDKIEEIFDESCMFRGDSLDAYAKEHRISDNFDEFMHGCDMKILF